MTGLAITVPARGIHARLSLHLHPRLTVLVGPNGSGKTRILDRLANHPPAGAGPVLYRLALQPLEIFGDGAAAPAKRRAKATDALLDRIFPAGRSIVAGAPRPDGELAARALADAIAERAPALALVDLPELFLDPDAQRRILPALLDAFPKTRFVVATHSPLVAASVRDARLYRLTRDADATGAPGKWTAVETDLHREAMPLRDFLRDAMGFEPSQPLWIEEALRYHVARVHSLKTTRGGEKRTWAALKIKQGGEKRAWADLKRQAEEAGIGRLLLDTLLPFLGGGTR